MKAMFAYCTGLLGVVLAGVLHARSGDLADALVEANRMSAPWNVGVAEVEEVPGDTIASEPASVIRVGTDFLDRLRSAQNGEGESYRASLNFVLLRERWHAKQRAAQTENFKEPAGRAALSCQSDLMAAHAFMQYRLQGVDLAARNGANPSFAAIADLRKGWSVFSEVDFQGPGSNLLSPMQRFTAFNLGVQRAIALHIRQQPALPPAMARFVERLKPFGAESQDDIETWSWDVCERIVRRDKDAFEALDWKKRTVAYDGDKSTGWVIVEQPVENRSDQTIRLSLMALMAVFLKANEDDLGQYEFVGTFTSTLDLLPGQTKTLKGRLYYPPEMSQIARLPMVDPARRTTPISARFIDLPTCAGRWKLPENDRFAAQLESLARIGFSASNGFRIYRGKRTSDDAPPRTYESRLKVIDSRETGIIIDERSGGTVLAEMYKSTVKEDALEFFRSTVESFRKYCDEEVGGLEELPFPENPTFRIARFTRHSELQLFMHQTEPHRFGPEKTEYTVNWILRGTN